MKLNFYIKILLFCSIFFISQKIQASWTKPTDVRTAIANMELVTKEIQAMTNQILDKATTTNAKELADSIKKITTSLTPQATATNNIYHKALADQASQKLISAPLENFAKAIAPLEEAIKARKIDLKLDNPALITANFNTNLKTLITDLDKVPTLFATNVDFKNNKDGKFSLVLNNLTSLKIFALAIEKPEEAAKQLEAKIEELAESDPKTKALVDYIMKRVAVGGGVSSSSGLVLPKIETKDIKTADFSKPEVILSHLTEKLKAGLGEENKINALANLSEEFKNVDKPKIQAIINTLPTIATITALDVPGKTAVNNLITTATDADNQKALAIIKPVIDAAKNATNRGPEAIATLERIVLQAKDTKEAKGPEAIVASATLVNAAKDTKEAKGPDAIAASAYLVVEAKTAATAEAVQAITASAALVAAAKTATGAEAGRAIAASAAFVDAAKAVKNAETAAAITALVPIATAAASVDTKADPKVIIPLYTAVFKEAANIASHAKDVTGDQPVLTQKVDIFKQATLIAQHAKDVDGDKDVLEKKVDIFKAVAALASHAKDVKATGKPAEQVAKLKEKATVFGHVSTIAGHAKDAVDGVNDTAVLEKIAQVFNHSAKLASVAKIATEGKDATEKKQKTDALNNARLIAQAAVVNKDFDAEGKPTTAVIDEKIATQRAEALTNLVTLVTKAQELASVTLDATEAGHLAAGIPKEESKRSEDEKKAIAKDIQQKTIATLQKLTSETKITEGITQIAEKGKDLTDGLAKIGSTKDLETNIGKAANVQEALDKSIKTLQGQLNAIITSLGGTVPKV